MKKVLAIILVLFLTPAAWGADYYVDATSAGGDGSSWENAENGLRVDTWNFVDAAIAASATEPVTIWVSGTFADSVSNRIGISTQYKAIYGQNYPITINGNPSGKDPARIVSMAYTFTSGWSSEGGGVYSRNWTSYSPNYDFALEDAGTDDQDLIEKYTLADCQSNAATYYMDTGTNTLYYHPSDGADANGHTFHIGNSFAVAIYTNSYNLEICNLTIRGGNIRVLGSNSNGLHIHHNNIMFDGNLGAIEYYVYGADYGLIEYNTIRYVRVGVYLLSSVSTPTTTHDYCTTRWNHVQDTGTKPYNAAIDDDHAYAQQGGIGNVWEYNTAINTGYAFASFPFGGQTTQNTTVRYNFFKTGHDFGSHANAGIFESTISDSFDDTNDNNRYYGNFISGFTIGLRPGAYVYGTDTMSRWDNNVVYNCTYGVYLTKNSVDHPTANASFQMRNNIFLNNTYHIRLNSGATQGYSYTFDHNLYYPDDGSRFYSVLSSPQSGNFAYWTALTNWGSGTISLDQTGSLVGDPSFLNTGGSYDLPSDYKLGSGSAAINAGTSVGITSDYDGNAITGVPEIGAFVYIEQSLTINQLMLGGHTIIR